MQRIAVIGNSGGGKSRLSRRLALIHGLKLVHVDSLQFLPGLKIRPHADSISELTSLQNEPQWIIDGYGPLDILEMRLKLADKIVFIDLPLWRHAWWITKRQFTNIFSPRPELPENSDELTLAHTKKLFVTLKKVHEQMRPEMLRILQKSEHKGKVIYIRNLKEWKQIYNSGIS